MDGKYHRKDGHTKIQAFQRTEFTEIRLPALKRMLGGLKPTVGIMVFTKDTLRVL